MRMYGRRTGDWRGEPLPKSRARHQGRRDIDRALRDAATLDPIEVELRRQEDEEYERYMEYLLLADSRFYD